MCQNDKTHNTMMVVIKTMQVLQFICITVGMSPYVCDCTNVVYNYDLCLFFIIM